MIKQLFTDCNTVLFLFVCQQTWNKFCGNTMHLQFFGQSCVAQTFTGAYFFRNFMDNFHESQHELPRHDRRLVTCKAVQIWDHLCWMFCPILNAGTTHDIVYGSNIPPHKPYATSASLHKSFSQFETEFHTITLLFKILHFSTGKKSPWALNTCSLKRM